MVRLIDIKAFRVKFIIAIGEGYHIRALINLEQFHLVPDLPLKILVSVEVLRACLTFLLDLFVDHISTYSS